MTASMQLKVDIVSRVLEGRIDKYQAAKILGKSTRSIERYLLAYSEKGISFVAHGNAGREPPNKTPESLKQKVQELHQEKYFDFNLTHLKEKLREDKGIDIGRETLRACGLMRSTSSKKLIAAGARKELDETGCPLKG